MIRWKFLAGSSPWKGRSFVLKKKKKQYQIGVGWNSTIYIFPQSMNKQRIGGEWATKRKDTEVGLEQQYHSSSWFCGLAGQFFHGFCLASVMSAGLENPRRPVTLAADWGALCPSKWPLALSKARLGMMVFAWCSWGHVLRRPRQKLQGPLRPRLQTCPLSLFKKIYFYCDKILLTYKLPF